MSTEKLRKVEDSFSERLKMLRKERGWSQEELATRLDVSPGSVGNWEIGPYEPHPKTLRKIAALFEVEVFFLLHGKREESPAAMQDKPVGYSGENLTEILREVEEVRDRLDRIAQQLRKATVKPSAAVGLTEVAAASYDRKWREEGKSASKASADTEAQRIIAKSESRHSK
jgi:transcriptional regulator with XRE-family HTH domain